MKPRFLTAAILIAALALYGAGMMAGGSVLVVMGAACKLWFWFRRLRRNANA
jgi:hypothetical protein